MRRAGRRRPASGWWVRSWRGAFRASVSRSSADHRVALMLRVRLLGGLVLEEGVRVLETPASRPARELLAWLALHPGSRTRLEVASRFWPDGSDAAARA